MKLPLTISLLASDRIATLERCLDSLKPLLLEVPAELIVVFTGTDPGVREAAERYTDQIVSFSWCNDFSAARNEGLKLAKGEWFLYLDDDEWFEDVTEICNFFKSGECNNYQSASYIVRNYLDWNGARYADAEVYRMARRCPKLHFENPIHEELYPMHHPCKAFDAYVHHYGYLRDIAEKPSGKSERNIAMLLKDIKRNPDYVKNYIQLSKEYCAQKNFEKAEEYCRLGRSICPDTEPLYKNWLQVQQVETLREKGDCNQAEKEAVSILENEHPVELVQLNLCQLLTDLCMKKEDYEKVLEYGMEAESLLEHMEKNPDLWIQQKFGFLNREKATNPEWLYPVRLNCIKASLELSKGEQAEYFLKLLPWDREYLIERYYPLLDQWKEDYGSLLSELLTALPYDSQYLLIQRLLSNGNPSLFCRCLKEIDLPYLLQKLIQNALQSKSDFSLLMKRMDLDSWNACITGIVDKTPYGDLQYLWEAQENILADYSLQGLWLKKLLLEKKLSRGFPAKKELLAALEEYALCIQTYYQNLYQKSIFGEERFYLLPADCRMSFTILEALKCWKQEKLPETIRLFRSALQIDPRMTGVVREVIRILNNEITHPAPAAGAEFEQLSVQMKAALKAMTDNRQYTEAMQVISQLLPLLPNDMELLKLQQQLINKI